MLMLNVLDVAGPVMAVVGLVFHLRPWPTREKP